MSTMTGAYWLNAVILMLTVGQEHFPLIEIDSDNICTVAVTANGKYIVGGDDGLGVWRVKDGKQMVTMAAGCVFCVAVSKDGRWVAAGTLLGEVFVWDTKTFKKVFLHRENHAILAVDFSPDLT